jgi:hypothetical protein
MRTPDVRVEDLSDKKLHDGLADYGFEFVDTSADAQRLEKAPLVVLSTKGANTPLIRIFSFEFRWENPRLVDAPAEMRKNHNANLESIWVDLNYNLYKNIFEVTPSMIKMTPKGVAVPAYRARTLFNRGMAVVLNTTNEIIANQQEYDALEMYHQKTFDIGFIGPYMVERVRRFLQQYEFEVLEGDFIDRTSNDHLRHALTEEQRRFVIVQVNAFIEHNRDLLEANVGIPKGETNEDINLGL